MFFTKIDLLQSTQKKNYLQKIEQLISDLQKKKKNFDSTDKNSTSQSTTIGNNKEKQFLIEISKFHEQVSKEQTNFMKNLQLPQNNDRNQQKNVITANVAVAKSFFGFIASKFTEKKNDETEEASYIGELINFFNESYIFEKWIQQYSILLNSIDNNNDNNNSTEQQKNIETIQKINNLLNKISEFFYNGVIGAFILPDILSVLKKQITKDALKEN